MKYLLDTDAFSDVVRGNINVEAGRTGESSRRAPRIDGLYAWVPVSRFLTP
jgi:hypothetical protein